MKLIKGGFLIRKKSQISMEYMTIAGFAFLMSFPLIIIFYNHVNDFNTDVSYTQMDRIGVEIINAADTVYYMGAPSQLSLRLYFPQNVQSITFRDNYMYINLSIKGQNRELNSWKYKSVGNLTGSLHKYPGIHNIIVKANQNNISITDK
ncbi:MAG: hypothetical protein QXG00_04330 [Candidatus Woesearchaeota archaeon]